MNTSANEQPRPHAVHVTTDADTLTITLSDGRKMSVPIVWYPRLAQGSAAERGNWRLIGGGEGIHWPDLDEDISVDALLHGLRSREKPESFKRWLETRARR